MRLARIEAEIDFPDEGLPPDLWAGIRGDVAALASEIAAHLDDAHRGERLRDGVSVAILGPPNAGKSSLLNALARRDIAITSAIAGTTRDVIEARLDLGGYPVLIADTAGLRQSADAIEQEGVRRALARAEAADLRLVILDATRPGETVDPGLFDDDALVVVNKIDAQSGKGIDGALGISVKTGAGMDGIPGASARGSGPARGRRRRAADHPGAASRGVATMRRGADPICRRDPTRACRRGSAPGGARDRPYHRPRRRRGHARHRVPRILHRKVMVPGEGIEPPTFGLQNRCSTAELARHEPTHDREPRFCARARPDRVTPWLVSS